MQTSFKQLHNTHECETPASVLKPEPAKFSRDPLRCNAYELCMLASKSGHAYAHFSITHPAPLRDPERIALELMILGTGLPVTLPP